MRDGSYRSSLSNKYQTIYNYRGSYGTRFCRSDRRGAGQNARLYAVRRGERRQRRRWIGCWRKSFPEAIRPGRDKELDTLYDQIANRKAFSYDLGFGSAVPAVP